MSEKFSLKDELFNARKVAYLGELFAANDNDFDAEKFQADVMAKLLSLELKARIEWIAVVLKDYLPDDFQQAADVIERALPAELDPTKTDDDFGDFIFAPLSQYAVNNGLEPQNFERSMALLHAITRRFSAEFAMREFIIAHQQDCLHLFKDWMQHDNYHVRRLVSESTRPVLPWARKINLAPTETQPFLNHLYADETRFVTRSVANHLNDLSRIDPDLVLGTLKRWKKEGKQSPKELDWLTRHALRTLAKQGHTEALSLLGYRKNPQLRDVSLKVSEKVAVGEQLTIDIAFEAVKSEKLMVDFVIEFIKSNGSSKPKVFKLKQLSTKAGEQVKITKRHRLLAAATTYKVYPGEHRVILQINGKNFAQDCFDLHL